VETRAPSNPPLAVARIAVSGPRLHHINQGLTPISRSQRFEFMSVRIPLRRIEAGEVLNNSGASIGGSVSFLPGISPRFREPKSLPFHAAIHVGGVQRNQGRERTVPLLKQRCGGAVFSLLLVARDLPADLWFGR